jgi:hypothetical protein
MIGVITIKTARGVPFNVRIVRKFHRYGRGECFTHYEDEPLIEFYDARYIEGFGPLGQFVARYYAETLLERDDYGLALYGRERDWVVDAATMRKLRAKMAEILAAEGLVTK